MELSKSNKGALAEKRVECLMITMGWLTYPCSCPNAPADMLIMRKSKILKVQVKSSPKFGTSAGSYKNLRQGANDILAVVTPESILLKVKSRQIARMFPGSVLSRPPKRHARAKSI